MLTVTAVLVITLGASFGVVRYIGGSPPERGPEGALAACAMAALLGAPGGLVLLARAGRPSLLVTAGAILVPLSMISLAGATLPLLIPAVALFVMAGRRARAGGTRPCAPPTVTTLAVLALLATAGAALMLRDDPRTYVTATGGGSVSDVITAGESVLSLWLTALALTTGWYLATPLALEGVRATARPA